jgi:hypothetical protein
MCIGQLFSNNYVILKKPERLAKQASVLIEQSPPLL